MIANIRVALRLFAETAQRIGRFAYPATRECSAVGRSATTAKAADL